MDFPGVSGWSTLCGHNQGPRCCWKFFELLATNEDVQVFDVRELLADGDSVVAMGHYRSRIRATGRTLEGEWAQVFRLRNGKIAGSRYYVDTAAVEAAYRPV